MVLLTVGEQSWAPIRMWMTRQPLCYCVRLAGSDTQSLENDRLHFFANFANPLQADLVGNMRQTLGISEGETDRLEVLAADADD